MLRHQLTYKTVWSLLAGFLSLAITHSAMSAPPAQDPLFLSQPVRPLMMLNMSNDHQLFFKLYADYEDLDDPKDGVPDTTYTHGYDYYGYFDSGKCYTYSTSENRFEPNGFADGSGYCNSSGATDEWSGNFLNWATMTRIDAVRKMLYGGKRSTDTATVTVLERSFLPHDAHAFAKFYDGPDVDRLTPFDDNASDTDVKDRGVTICNTTVSSGTNELSQDVDDPPLLRIAQGNFSLWASNERWQCRWRGDMSNSGQGKNGNNSSVTGINAHDDSPTKASDQLGQGDYNVRVQVCKDGLIGSDNSENCRAYGSSQKPSGLLQEYGEKGTILFGLMTGSYDKNKSGGVLRKTIGDMSDEIDLTDGTFKTPADATTFNGIIDTLDKLRIYGYRYEDGTYFGVDASDQCGFQLSSFDNGKCRNWGNPQSEIYLESLRYLGAKGVNTEFQSDDSDRITNLNTATWDAPVTNDNYCAPLSVIQFNASTSSYDGDDLAKASDLDFTSPASLDLATDAVGTNEGLNTGTYFFGKLEGSANTSAGYELCTAKSITGLSDVRGTCPDAPRLDGSYQIAGMAYHARKNGIPITGVTKKARHTVRTYGVALAPAVPSVTVPVPSSSDKTVTIQPACRNTNPDPDGNCALVDFKIVEQESTTVVIGGFDTPVQRGKLYVNWEDSEQGGDFDQDMWGVIDYQVTANNVAVTTNVIQESTSGIMGFGYVISGTTSDGFHVHSGIEGFTHTPVTAPIGATIQGCGDATGDTDGCQRSDSATTNTYVIGSSTAEPLQQPLYYAAKWGGYADDAATATDIAAADPETYYSATDPRKLQEELRAMFSSVAASVGSAASVATNSTRLTEGAYVYQARFNSKDWTGELLAFEIDSNNNISSTALVSTDSTMFTSANASGRNVVTYNPTTGLTVDFAWSSLTAAQQAALIDGDDATIGERRLNWIRGENTHEGSVGGLRQRDKLLGDIVSSSPVYLGGRDRGYGQLPAAAGGGTPYENHLIAKRAEQPSLFVGGNDGMLHVFDAQTLQERAAYVPNGVYDKLARLSDPNYGRADVPHHYTVDGPLAVGDAYIGGNWKSVLVGTLGAGGKSVYALDVTDPDDPKVLFDLDSADFTNQLGYVLGKPIIARMANGRWAAVFGNGYDSGNSKLFVVDLESPKLSDGYTRIIDTGTGNGLSAVELLGDATGQVTYAYAGDLDGNMWKFDLTSNSASGWAVAYSGAPLFTAKDSAGIAQPITGAPTLGYNEERGGVINVYFGTGKYFEHSDNTHETGDPRHSFYAIADEAPVTGTRASVLFEKHLSDSATTRTVPNDENMDWSNSSHKGWFIDFDTRTGEQVTTKPLLLYDHLIFPTLIPSAVACEYGGQSWLMELAAVGDKFVGEGLLGENVNSESLILSEPSYGVVDENTGKLIISYSSGELREEDPKLPDGALGRQSWRQLR